MHQGHVLSIPSTLTKYKKFCAAAVETRNLAEKEQTVVSRKEEKQEVAGGWDIGDWKDEEESQGNRYPTLYLHRQ